MSSKQASPLSFRRLNERLRIREDDIPFRFDISSLSPSFICHICCLTLEYKSLFPSFFKHVIYFQPVFASETPYVVVCNEVKLGEWHSASSFQKFSCSSFEISAALTCLFPVLQTTQTARSEWVFAAQAHLLWSTCSLYRAGTWNNAVSLWHYSASHLGHAFDSNTEQNGLINHLSRYSTYTCNSYFYRKSYIVAAKSDGTRT